MKSILILSALLLLISENARAGMEYDKCIQEEKALKAQEAGDCSGLKYLLNPSGCFATQKALKGYASGKCRQIGMAENVDFTAQKVSGEKKISTTAGSGNAVPVNNIESVSVKQALKEQPQQYTLEQLKAENARLKAEISRLKTENEQLRNAGR